MQIFFFILANVIYSIYLVMKKPYIRIGWRVFTTEVIVHNVIVISLILIVILAFKIQVNSLSSGEKSLMGTVICLLVLYGMVSNFVYFVYRTYNYYFDNVWKLFVKTEMFKENYTVEHYELVKKYTEMD